jgi:hypothetical protein
VERLYQLKQIVNEAMACCTAFASASALCIILQHFCLCIFIVAVVVDEVVVVAGYFQYFPHLVLLCSLGLTSMQYLHLVHASSSYLIVRDQVGCVWHADSVQWMHFSGSSWLRILTSQSFSPHAAGHQSGCESSGIEVVVGTAVVAGGCVVVGAGVVLGNVVVSGFSSAEVVAAVVVNGASVVVLNGVVAKGGVVVGAVEVLNNVVVSGFCCAEVVAAVVVNGASVVVVDGVVAGGDVVVGAGVVLRNPVVSGFSRAEVVDAVVVNGASVVVVGTHNSCPL